MRERERERGKLDAVDRLTTEGLGWVRGTDELVNLTSMMRAFGRRCVKLSLCEHYIYVLVYVLSMYINVREDRKSVV